MSSSIQRKLILFTNFFFQGLNWTDHGCFGCHCSLGGGRVFEIIMDFQAPVFKSFEFHFCWGYFCWSLPFLSGCFPPARSYRVKLADMLVSSLMHLSTYPSIMLPLKQLIFSLLEMVEEWVNDRAKKWHKNISYYLELTSGAVLTEVEKFVPSYFWMGRNSFCVVKNGRQKSANYFRLFEVAWTKWPWFRLPSRTPAAAAAIRLKDLRNGAKRLQWWIHYYKIKGEVRQRRGRLLGNKLQ